MSHAESLKCAVLQIAHDSIKFHHTVGNRCAGGKSDSFSSGDLIQILALHEHVRAFLRVGLGYSRHIAHLGVEKSIFVKMTFIHKETVHAQLLKGHDIVLALLVIQFCKPHFQSPAGLLHLLNGIVFTSIIFEFCDGILNIINLPLDRCFLPFPGKRNPLKLAVADNNGVIIPCSYP